jgi:hypothetical protein
MRRAARVDRSSACGQRFPRARATDADRLVRAHVHGILLPIVSSVPPPAGFGRAVLTCRWSWCGTKTRASLSLGLRFCGVCGVVCVESKLRGECSNHDKQASSSVTASLVWVNGQSVTQTIVNMFVGLLIFLLGLVWFKE